VSSPLNGSIDYKGTPPPHKPPEKTKTQKKEKTKENDHKQPGGKDSVSSPLNAPIAPCSSPRQSLSRGLFIIFIHTPSIL